MGKTHFLGLCIFLGGILCSPLTAEPWKLAVNSSLLTTLNSFSDNWVGGNAGSFTWAAQGMGIAEKQLSLRVNNKNTLKLAYGQTKTQDKETKHWSAPINSADLIDFESIFKVALGWFVDPYVSMNLLSQFSDQRDSAQTHYLNPMDIKESVGGLRELIKNNNVLWSARFGATVHQVVDRVKWDSLSHETVRDVANDGGAELVTEFKAHNKSNGIQYVGTLKLYEALIRSRDKTQGSAPENSDWRHPHLNWENMLTFNLAKYVMLSVYGQLLYDKPVSRQVRLKETFSLGLTYSFDSNAAKPQ